MRIGIPPTDATLTKKNNMLIKTKQNPIEYKSLLLNSIAGFLNSLFKKYLGSIADPIKNAINAIANVIAKLAETALIDSIRNAQNTTSTISGLNASEFNILFFLINPKKFSPG